MNIVVKMATKRSTELFSALRRLGYPEVFCEEIAYNNLNTDFTANRMLAYLSRAENPTIEELVDEMYAILSDRDRIVEKHLMENAQAKLNEINRNGLETDE